MGDSWESWIQNVGGGLIKTAAEAKWSQPFQLQQMRLQAYGPYGDPYVEGQANAVPAVLPTSWLLIGGALVAAVLILRD